MDLKTLLQANKARTEKPVTPAPSSKNEKIISIDRPYDFLETDKEVTNNRQESDNEVAINRQEVYHKPTRNWQESDRKVASKPTIEVTRKRQESDNKQTRKCTFSLLVGRERQITFFLFQFCKNTRSRITDPITLEHIASSLGISKNNAKTTIQNIEAKGVLVRNAFKNGRGGWTQYEIPDHIYNEIIQLESDNKLTMNRQETDNELASKPTSKPTINDSRRREFNINRSSSLTEGWNFDISSFEKFGFNTTRLKQLMTINKLSAQEIYQSLIEFEHDYSKNTLPKINTSPINYLMGGLISGSPYSSVGYQKEVTRIANEFRERYEKNQAEKQKSILLDWFEGLNQEQKEDIEKKLPGHLQIRFNVDGIFESQVFNWLKNYYYEKSKG